MINAKYISVDGVRNPELYCPLYKHLQLSHEWLLVLILDYRTISLCGVHESRYRDLVFKKIIGQG